MYTESDYTRLILYTAVIMFVNQRNIVNQIQCVNLSVLNTIYYIMTFILFF